MKHVLSLFICLSLVNCSRVTHLNKEFRLGDEFKIVIPVTEDKVDSLLTYSGIEIWKGKKLVYTDTGATEYFFNSKAYHRVFKLENGNELVLISVFDAPDLNKIAGYYFENSKLIKLEVYPDFLSSDCDTDNDGKPEFAGLLNISESPCSSCDSCFYNPTLYYELTESGLDLDSSLTRERNKKIWGSFYGFSQTEIVLPCPRDNTPVSDH